MSEKKVRLPTHPRKALHALAAVAGLLMGSEVFAFTAPAVGSFGFDIYDILVNQILLGPIGFCGGIFLIVWGGAQVMKNWVITILSIIAGTIIIRADALVQSLGALV